MFAVWNVQHEQQAMRMVREGDVMNDAAKVVRYGNKCNEFGLFIGQKENGGYVTHADYQALEERFAEMRRAEAESARKVAYLMNQGEEERAELASLRAKVGELIEADRDFDAAVDHIDMAGPEAYERRKAAMEALS